MNFVTTAKARNAIRGYLKNLKRDEAQELGRRLLNQELMPYSLSLRKLPKERLDALRAEFGIKDLETLFEQVGLGERLAPVIAGMLAQQEDEPGSVADHRKPLEIAGTEGMVVNYARCCYPIPGDEIVGFMSTGRGIVIHRDNCRNLAEYRKQPVEVDSSKLDEGRERRVRFGDPGAYAGSRRPARRGRGANFRDAHEYRARSRRHAKATRPRLSFRLKVRDRRQLAQVVRSIRTIPGVVRVTRSAG